MDIRDLDLPAAEKMSRRKKWWIIGILLGIFGLLIFQYFRDDTLDDLSDLMNTERPAVDASENGLRHFDSLLAKEDVYDPLFDELREMYNKSSSWDEKRAREILKECRPFLDAMELAAKEPFLKPKATKVGDYDPRQGLLQSTMLLITTDIKLASGEESVDTALRHVENLLAIAPKLAVQCGSLVDFLYATAYNSHALRNLETIICDENTDWNANAIRLLGLLQRAESNAQILEDRLPQAYDFEFQWMQQIVEDFDEHAGDFSGDRLPLVLLKRNRTINQLAAYTRSMQSDVSKNLVDTTEPFYSRPSLLKLCFSGNYTGEIILSMMSPMDIWRSSFIYHRSETEMLQVLFALRSFHAEHQKLPDALTQLVPEYLPELPLDRYNGEALHYDKTRARIWSVGKDLIDDNSPSADDEEENFKKMEDPMKRLEWLAE